MARRPDGQATPALQELTRAGVPFTVRSYDHDPDASSYGLEAAELLDLDPRRVYKTLMVEADGRLAVGIVPVSGSLDLKAIAHALGAKKAQMADIARAERATGYVAGGISPSGRSDGIPPSSTPRLRTGRRCSCRRAAGDSTSNSPPPTWSA